MKNNLLVIIFSICSVSFAQNELVLGKWYGELNAMGTKLRFNAEVNELNGVLKATLSSPDQNAYGIKTDSVSFINEVFYFNSKALNASYKGNLKDNKITGKFTQGMEFELNFQRDSIVKEEAKRPQEPKPPFNYYTEDIVVKNKKANIDLEGTLTLPNKEGKFPVVILITGSGPQNRDSEILGHKPFLVWADYLAKQGIGSFRYDDRGVGASTGKYTTAGLNDFYSDAESVVKVISKRKEVASLGIMGHSEGGILAPWLASNCKKIDFVVMLAGPGVPITELMAEQRKLVSSNAGVTENDIEVNNKMFEQIDAAILILDKSVLNDTLFKIMTNSFREMEDERYKSIPFRMQVAQLAVAQVTSNWYKSFIAIKPAEYLTKVKQPLFAINGDKDSQIASYQNIPAIDKALSEGKCKNYQTKIYPNLNHLFQECKTGMLDEYGKIEETINPAVLNDVANWINNLPK